ncbi:TnsA endonuclease N-terminal domain-containing protein [Priestia flexa]|uniref:TnsA endonuclease N-terminal domain-containing protein n=1 Tax=Priestia flexa TaxID=86664 RepID=UPI0020A2011D|nr:TnsA endonuclease N-terminal domain-containing protein [Priestia flexa]MCP1187729.1 TnsA endonuclease N-terminal domain-containing protein [Priestia flexa]
MAKRKRENSTESKIERWIKEGRGQGEGTNYQPWLEIQDVASEGYATRNKGWKTQRKHYFLSELELQYFYTLEWSPYVVDVREQYPLLQFSSPYLERTIEIAERLGINHPKENGSTGPLKVITTDFYLIVRTKSGLKTVVRSIKPTNNLTIRELEKYQRLDVQARFENNLEKLLKCKGILQDITETVEEFQIRKIRHFGEQFRRENMDFSISSLTRIAGIKKISNDFVQLVILDEMNMQGEE